MGRVVYRLLTVLMLMLAAFPGASAWAKAPVELKGSRASMLHQNSVAKEEGFSSTGTFSRAEAGAGRKQSDGYRGRKCERGPLFVAFNTDGQLPVQQLAADFLRAFVAALLFLGCTNPRRRLPMCLGIPNRIRCTHGTAFRRIRADRDTSIAGPL